jgi:hypothetical protein
MENNWTIQVKDWTLISKDSALFIIGEADKYLKYTIEVSDKVTARAFSFLLICISIFTAIIGFTFKYYSENPGISLNLICNLLFAIMLLINCYLLILIVSPRFFMMTGRIPKEIAIPDFLDNQDLTAEQSHLALILNEIENCQTKIEYNINQNQDRLKMFKRTLIVLILGSAIYLALMLVIVS